MMEIVESRTNELARNREHLEEMVEQRTAELSRAVTAAKSANEAKSRFLATMSHELRTPMNGVLGMAQLLLSGPVDNSKTQDHARTILHSGQSLLTLLNDILDLSKIESGTQTLDAGMVNPIELLQNTQALFANNAHGKGLKLSVRWKGPHGRRYRGDANRLQQMLSNLTNNAIKFTAVGEVCIEATELNQEDGTATVEWAVQDSAVWSGSTAPWNSAHFVRRYLRQQAPDLPQALLDCTDIDPVRYGPGPGGLGPVPPNRALQP
jgi:signal transduction histidine kinase